MIATTSFSAIETPEDKGQEIEKNDNLVGSDQGSKIKKLQETLFKQDLLLRPPSAVTPAPSTSPTVPVTIVEAKGQEIKASNHSYYEMSKKKMMSLKVVGIEWEMLCLSVFSHCSTPQGVVRPSLIKPIY